MQRGGGLGKRSYGRFVCRGVGGWESTPMEGLYAEGWGVGKVFLWKVYNIYKRVNQKGTPMKGL